MLTSPEAASLYCERLEDLKAATTNSEKSDELYESVLEVSEKRVIKIMLSYGGPSDGFELHVDNDSDIVEVYYWYANWGTYQTKKLHGSDFELAKILFECYVERWS